MIEARQRINIKKYNCAPADTHHCRMCLGNFGEREEGTKLTKQIKIMDEILLPMTEKIYCQICSFPFHKNCVFMFQGSGTFNAEDKFTCSECAYELKNKRCVVCKNKEGWKCPLDIKKKTPVAHWVCMYFSSNFLIEIGKVIHFHPLLDPKSEQKHLIDLYKCDICTNDIRTGDFYFECPCLKKAHIYCGLKEDSIYHEKLAIRSDLAMNNDQV